jgi:tryptophan 2,3-dioxygenase
VSESRSPDPVLTYEGYLALDQLLSLQRPRSNGPEHDEMLFIVIHQIYELWFKQLLHEIDRVAELFGRDEPHRAQHTLKRMLTILKILVGQLDILETMTPLEFLSFRARLEAASGFQSNQFRQIEFALGAKDAATLARFHEGSLGRDALERRYREPTIWDAFLHYLAREGYPVPAAQLARDYTTLVEPTPEIQQVLLTVYRHDAKSAEICERLVDLDEGIAEWRYRHVRMVERTIGSRPGTGGTQGVAYLRTTQGRNLFPDLWDIRASL